MDNNKKPFKIQKFIPHHFKAKNMCKNAVKKLLFAIMYVPDWYKTQEMCV